ncbi:MAG: methanogen output domain 1-containing protein [Methanomassiliicoccales archaeon]
MHNAEENMTVQESNPMMKALVINCNGEVSSELVRILHEKNYAVFVAKSLEETIELQKRLTFDIIAVDRESFELWGNQLPTVLLQFPDRIKIIIFDHTLQKFQGSERVRFTGFKIERVNIEDFPQAIESFLSIQHGVREVNISERMPQARVTQNHISKTEVVDDMLGNALEEIRKHFNVDMGAAYLNDGEKWILKRYRNVSEKFVKSFSSLSDQHPLILELTKKKAPLLFVADRKQDVKRSWLVVPLFAGERIRGALILVSNNMISLTSNDLEFLRSIMRDFNNAIDSSCFPRAVDEREIAAVEDLGNIPQVMILYDLEGKVKYWSHEAERKCGYSQEEAKGSYLIPFLTSRHNKILDNFKRAIEGPISVIELIERKDGTTAAAEVRFWPVISSASGPAMISMSLGTSILLDELINIDAHTAHIHETAWEALMDLISLLLKRNIPDEDKDEYINIISQRIEKALYPKYIQSEKDVSAEVLATGIVRLFADIGGRFSYTNDENKIEIIGTKCPWDNERRKNPVLCALTKGIIIRFAKRALDNKNVALKEALANGDPICRIVINKR